MPNSGAKRLIHSNFNTNRLHNVFTFIMHNCYSHHVIILHYIHVYTLKMIYDKFYVARTVLFGMNRIMTNVMHKFLINLSLYFCLTCFGFSLSPSSEAGVQIQRPGTNSIPRRLEPLPNLYTCL
jgi:hypothetical protein